MIRDDRMYPEYVFVNKQSKFTSLELIVTNETCTYKK